MSQLPVVHFGPLQGPAYLVERLKMPDGSWSARIAYVVVGVGEKLHVQSQTVPYEDITPIPGQDYSGVKTRVLGPPG